MAQPLPAAGLDPEDLGPTVAEWIGRQIADNRATWQQTPGLYEWWLGQLHVVNACYLYSDGDPRVRTYGLQPGGSKHLRLLATSDFATARQIRLATNLGARRRNEQKRARYARELARWEAGQRRVGGGRRAAKPAEPIFEKEYDPDQPAISPRTEQAFGMAQSFLFDRADSEGLFHGPNPWRLYKPRGSGGRRGERKSTYRKVVVAAATERSFPGPGFFVDLGDTLASLGDVLDDGRRAGERYRILPLLAWQTAPRPGELCLLRADELPKPTAETAGDLAIPALKRQRGTFRNVALSQALSTLSRWHVAAGYGSHDRRLFASPRGRHLDPSNWNEDYLRAALGALCGADGLWPEYSDLAGATMKMFRKAAVSGWLAYGLDPSRAAKWAGHDESVQITHYKGMVAVAARNGRRWSGVDNYVRDALADAPPRGRGELANAVAQLIAPR